MQSAGRAVASSHQSSLYSSSRHALARPAACHATEGTISASISPSPSTLDRTQNTLSPIASAASSVRLHISRPSASIYSFSQPAAQKRHASSKPRPVALFRSKPTDQKSNVAKPLVYRGREAASSNKNDYTNNLSSNPYLRGRTISPSSSPNAIFEPQIRRPSIVIRPPPGTSAPPEDTAASNTAPSSSPSQTHPTSDQGPAAPSLPPQQESQSSSHDLVPPLERSTQASAPSNSPQNSVRPVSDRGLAHAVDDVAVPEGITSAERPVPQPKEPFSRIKEQKVASIESRASVFDEVLRLEQRNSKLESTLAQHRKDYQELRQAHDKLQESSVRTIQDAQRLELQARERLQATSKKFEQDRLDLQGTVRKQEVARVELSRQLVQVKKELEKEKDAAKQQQRRAADRHSENALRLREQEEREKAARKLFRKDYNTFRAWGHIGVTKTAAILVGTELLPRQDAWFNREIAYWDKALQSTRSFEVTSKGGDQFRFWEAGEQVQKTTQDPQERDTLRRRVIHQLEQRLQHRNGIFDQVKGYLQNSSLEASRAHSDYTTRLEDLREKFDVIKARQHDYRRILRATRFGMDPKSGSPELTAASRASAIDLYEIDRPIAEINGAVVARILFWNRKLKALMAQTSDTSAMGPMIRFYRTQLMVLKACKSLLQTLRVFSSLQLEALEADWISEQPTYQQLFWQTSIRIARRVSHTRTKANMIAKDLRAQGLGRRHQILSLRDIDRIVEPSVLHERAAFAYAYVKHKKNAFTQDDKSEISGVLAQYRIENTQETRRYLKQLEQVWQISNDINDARHSEALGKRLLVPARTRRRENLRKAALAKTRHDEGVVEDQATPVVEAAAAGTTTGIPQSASDAEMTSRDTSAGSTADLEKSESSLHAESSGANTTGEAEPATSEGSSSESAESLREPQIKPRGPEFKLAKIPRLTPKATTVYPRARSKSLFRPPKPMFKETRRRSQMMSTSSADYLDQGDIGHASTFPPLLHHIPPQDLRNALMASKTSQAAFWKYSLYKSPKNQKPLVHYCWKFEQAERYAKMFLGEPVIGFDIEWEAGSTIGDNSIKENVSLIQIACDDRIALFHIALFFGERPEDLMPPSLKAILESPEVLKTGVNIATDFTRLRKCLGVEGQGIFEVSHLYKLVKFSENEPAKVDKKPFNLAGQVQDVLFLPLHKGVVRTSAWSKKLSLEQTDYAASDAYAGFRLFRELDKARSLMNPMPPRPAPWEHHQPIIFGNGEQAGRKTFTKKSTGLESQFSMLSVEEEQILNDEEEEAQDEAGADDLEDDSAQYELERSDNEPAASVKYEAAERWLAQWASNSTLGKKNKPPSAVRAYALWQVEGLELQQVAEAMREPPLALSTVATYVVQVVKTQKLPHEPARLQVALEMEERRYKSSIQKTRSII